MGFFYDTNKRWVTFGIKTNITGVTLCNTVALGTENDFFFNVDIRYPDRFTSLSSFLSQLPEFEDNKDEDLFNSSAKKFYFIYLMGLGGQSGYKKFIKDQIISGNSYQMTLENLSLELKNNGDEKKKKGLINDFHAALRNERQIFFYYGIFYGNDNTDLYGFHNLTTIGKSILKANFHELLLVWEHQKIRMISQSPNTKISNLDDFDKFAHTRFSINYHPYIFLLEIVLTIGEISKEHYQYVISRMNHKADIGLILKNGFTLSNHINPNEVRKNQ